MIPRRNRELPFGRNSFLFSYKRRYNGNLCACSVQQAKAASSMMICTLSALAEYFLSTTVLCARNVSPTAYFLPTAAKSMQKMPPETNVFCTSFPMCKSCFPQLAEAGNWFASTLAAATWAVEEVRRSTVRNGLPRR